MKNFTKLTALSLVATLALVGCGSSSNDSTLEGYFIDAAVAGAEYNTSSGLKGITDIDGKFKYNNGDRVTFTLGKIVLGEATPLPDGLVTPKTLIAGDATPTTDESSKITLLLQTLQSLDSDNDPSNGITISNDIITELENLAQTTEFKSLDEESLIELDNTYDLGLDEDYDGKLDVNTTDAQTHFNGSLKDWDNGKKPNHTATLTTSTQLQNGSGNGGKHQYGKTDTTGGAAVTNTDVTTSATTHNQFDINNYPSSTLTQELRDALAHMGNEERLAYDVYTNLYNYHINNSMIAIAQLTNIATRSEATHVDIVQSVVQRYDLNATELSDVDSAVAPGNSIAFDSMQSGVYDIEAIQNLYNSLYDLGTQSYTDALKVGCMVEVVDVNDLDEYIKLAEESNATDILEAFKVLRDGSYNHYWAFDKGLKNAGVANGCYVEGDALLGENKEGIYPTNENGH